MRRRISPQEQFQRGAYRALFSMMRPDQIAFANHLLSSWRVRRWPSNTAIEIENNVYLPIVRRAMKTAIERRP